MTDLAVSPGGRPINYAPLGPKALWRTKGLKLPDYIRGVARGINPADPESAIDEAVAAIKRWALTSENPSVRAAAAKALAEWEAAKAAAHALSTTGQKPIDLATVAHTYHWKHGWIPLDGDLNSPKHLGGGLMMIPGHHGGAAHITHWNVKVDGDHVGQVQIMSAKRVMARRRQPASGDMRRISHFESPEAAARWIGRSHPSGQASNHETMMAAVEHGKVESLPRSMRATARAVQVAQDRHRRLESATVTAHVAVREGIYRGATGFHITGMDSRGRKVSVFVPGNRAAADRAAANIRAGKGAFELSTDIPEAIDLAMTKGALPPLPGSSKPRFPINDHTDLKKAVKAVGRAKTGHAAIRRHIIARAKAIGGTHLLPANWTSTGNMK